MSKEKTLNKIYEVGIVPVVRAESSEKAIKIVEAIKEGGINVVEITMTVPGAIGLIRELREKYKDEEKVVIGAGSVLDSETTRSVILAGAEFVVGPTLNEGMVKIANRYQVLVIPGAMTPTEVLKAMELGADVVKIFPAELFGPRIIRAIKGPIPQAKLLPTGGVNHDNVKEWIEVGSFAVGAGGSIVNGAEKGDFIQVRKSASKFVKLIKEARK